MGLNPIVEVLLIQQPPPQMKDADDHSAVPSPSKMCYRKLGDHSEQCGRWLQGEITSPLLLLANARSKTLLETGGLLFMEGCNWIQPTDIPCLWQINTYFQMFYHR